MHARSGSPARLCSRDSDSPLCVVACSLLRGLFVAVGMTTSLLAN